MGQRNFCNTRAGLAEGRVSKVYRRKLARVQEERDTAQAAVDYVRSHWDSASLFNEPRFEAVKREKVISLAQNIDTIFLNALFAAFGEMLREHMKQHYSGTLIPQKAGASFLTDQVATAQPQRITVAVCNRVHEVRQYRNSLMHRSGEEVIEITFSDALAYLSRYVGWLPEPL